MRTVMGQENERKYLVRSDAWRNIAEPEDHYRQGYLSIEPDRSVRVRAGVKKAYITIKARNGNGSGLSRSEFEYPIPIEDANQLLDQVCQKPLIEKTRYRVARNGTVWTIDEFENENRDLLLAEVETKSGQAPRQLPDWVGQDVSNDDRYENANLVQHPFSEWHGKRQEPEAKYCLKHGESIARGLERVIREQLALAIWQLSENIESLDHAVHDARKSVKKTRSALRLVRGVLGRTYAAENDALRDVGRKLSPVRDSQALIEMFDELNDKYRDKFGDKSLLAIRDGLVARKNEAAEQFQKKGQAGQLLDVLREIHAGVKKWPLNRVALPSLLKGFSTTIIRNREAFEDAYDSSRPDRFHEWRKRAKDMRYHLSLVRKAWDPVLKGYMESAKDLESDLGDDHNLVVLRDTILKNPKDFGSQSNVRTFLDVMDSHQRKLREKAKASGTRLYAEKPREWQRRLETSWKAWRH